MPLHGYYQNELMRMDKASQRLREVMDGLSPAFFIGTLTLDATVTYANKTALELIGLELKDVLGKRFEDTPWWSYSELYRQQLREAIVRANLGESSRFDVKFQHADGHVLIVDFSLNPVFDVKKKVTYLVPSAHDVTERRAAERALTMLRVCNQSLIRAQNERTLLQDICRLVVDIGGYRMVWVGYAQQDDARSIKPIAHAGDEQGYLLETLITWAENDPKGQGPGGQCIRSGQSIVSDVGKDDFIYWRELAYRHGFRGVISLPLRDESVTFGILGLYSANSLKVTSDEIQLLQELADNLAFGIINLRKQQERQQVLSAVYKIADGVSLSTGSAFFEKLVLSLTEAVGAQIGVIMRLTSNEPPTARTLMAVVDGKVIENFDVILAGTPCANIDEQRVECIVPTNAAKLYPQANMLTKLGAEAYVGRQIINSFNEPIGTLFVLFRQPIENTKFVSSILKIFTARVAAEMETMLY